MDNLDKALKFIRSGYTYVTPQIAEHLKISQKATDELLAPLIGSELVSCQVLKNGRRMRQYRKTGVIF